MFRSIILLAFAVVAVSASTIVDLAVATKDLSTLVAALKAGGLVDTLNGKGPFTVFAPTNEAFAKIPKDYLDHLLDPKNVKELQELLTYHVAGGDVQAKDLSNGEKIKTVEGSDVYVRLDDNKVELNCLWHFCEAEVTTANVEASNGVVHIVNGILIPPRHQPHPAPTPASNSTIVQLAEATPDLSTLVTALSAGKLVTTLSSKGPFTVFAPTNEAFAALPKATLDFLLEPKNIKDLQAVLTYHVAAGAVYSKDLHNREKITTVEGSQVEAFVFDHKVYINNARVEKADIGASNGVVHIIEKVLIPKQIQHMIDFANAM